MANGNKICLGVLSSTPKLSKNNITAIYSAYGNITLFCMAMYFRHDMLNIERIASCAQTLSAFEIHASTLFFACDTHRRVAYGIVVAVQPRTIQWYNVPKYTCTVRRRGRVLLLYTGRLLLVRSSDSTVYSTMSRRTYIVLFGQFICLCPCIGEWDWLIPEFR